jgi:hypothetical protein
LSFWTDNQGNIENKVMQGMLARFVLCVGLENFILGQKETQYLSNDNMGSLRYPDDVSSWI